MTEPESTTPIDWHRFWTDADDDRRRSAHVGQYGKAELLASFFDEYGVPDSFAAVGCGPAGCPIELAKRFPNTAIYGYDAAPSAIEEARERIVEEGLENVTVAVDRLPQMNVERRFDVVYCYATLHYIADAETALRELFDRVGDGRHLVFNYPNRLTLATYRRLLGGDTERPLPGEPTTFANGTAWSSTSGTSCRTTGSRVSSARGPRASGQSSTSRTRHGSVVTIRSFTSRSDSAHRRGRSADRAPAQSAQLDPFDRRPTNITQL